MFDAMLNLLSYMGTMWLTNGELPQPPGSGHDYTVPWQAFSAKDGYVVVATREESFWRRLCELLEDPALADDPRFNSNANRVKNKDVLVPRLEEIFHRRTVADWLERLRAAGVPAAPSIAPARLPKTTDRHASYAKDGEVPSCDAGLGSGGTDSHVIGKPRQSSSIRRPRRQSRGPSPTPVPAG